MYISFTKAIYTKLSLKLSLKFSTKSLTNWIKKHEKKTLLTLYTEWKKCSLWQLRRINRWAIENNLSIVKCNISLWHHTSLAVSTFLYVGGTLVVQFSLKSFPVWMAPQICKIHSKCNQFSARCTYYTEVDKWTVKIQKINSPFPQKH